MSFAYFNRMELSNRKGDGEWNSLSCGMDVAKAEKNIFTKNFLFAANVLKIYFSPCIAHHFNHSVRVRNNSEE